MNTYTTVGYKSNFSKTIILILGIGFMIYMYYLIYYFLKFHNITFAQIIIFVIIGLMFFTFNKKISGLKYIFSQEGITIVTNKRQFLIKKQDIDILEKIYKLSLLKGYGTTSNPLTNEIFFLTSNEVVLKIGLKDGRIIYISPRIIKDEIFNYYTK